MVEPDVKRRGRNTECHHYWQLLYEEQHEIKRVLTFWCLVCGATKTEEKR